MALSQKEIVKYYIGNYFQVSTPSGSAIMKLSVVVFDDVGFISGDTENKEYWEIEPFQEGYTLQPYLRCVGYMSDQEETEYYELCKIMLSATRESMKYKDLKNWKVVKKYADTADSFAWLIRNGFDAFDLIENGLALNILKLPNNLRQNNTP